MNNHARTFHEDHLQRKLQSFQFAYMRAHGQYDGSSPLFLHQDVDFLGHFEPDLAVSLAMLPEVMQQDPVAGLMMITSHLPPQQADVLLSAVEKGNLNSTLMNQLFGVGNLPGNLANLVEAAVKARFTARMKTELKSMLTSGQARTVKLGNEVELKAVGFKGPNQFGKHADVLIRLRQPQAMQITLLEKNQFQPVSKNMRAKSLGSRAFNVDKVVSLSRVTSDELWRLGRLSGASWLGSVKVGGVLAFAPTLAGDIINNYNQDAKLGQRFNWKGFATDTVANQTGNLLAMGGGILAAAFVGGLGVAGAPVVMAILGG